MNAHIYPMSVVFCDLDLTPLLALFKNQNVDEVIEALALVTINDGSDEVYSATFRRDDNLLRFIVVNGKAAVAIKLAYAKTLAEYRRNAAAQARREKGEEPPDWWLPPELR